MSIIRRGPARLHLQTGGERTELGTADVTIDPAPELDPPLVAAADEPGVWTVTDLPKPSQAPGAPNSRPDDVRPTEGDHRPADGGAARRRALP